MDARSLLFNLRGLIAQANEAVAEILKLVKVQGSALPRKGLEPLQAVDTSETLASHSTNEDSAPTEAVLQGALTPYDCLQPTTLFDHMLQLLMSLTDFSSDSVYKDAPGVVQVPVFTDAGSVHSSKLPDFAMGERWIELTPHNGLEGDTVKPALEVLLPSRLWLLRRELFAWNDLPLNYTPTQLKAAAGLAMVKRADLKRWLFTHARPYGIALSRSLANHIAVLLVFCLRAVYREATLLLESREKAGLVECRVLTESASWLCSQLSLLCDTVASRNLVLGLYKYALEAGAYCIILSQSGSFEYLHGEESLKAGCFKGVGASPEQMSQNHTCTSLETCGDRTFGSSFVGDGFLGLQQLAAAIVAIQAQAYLDKYRTSDSLAFHSSSSQRSAVHSMVAKRAEEVRATRADYRAVLEHDGLIWQRPQNQDLKKNKTKEEILAEERDYKRRRMSYRGKKVQRTPAEVLRDIIEGHMEEIVAAGGIGNFGRRPQDWQISESETELSALGTKDHIDAAQKIRSSSRDTEDKELGRSHLDYSRYSRSESRGPFSTDKGDRHRSTSVSLSSSSQRNDPSYPRRHDRLTHEHYGDKFSDRKYDSTRELSRWEKVLDVGERSNSSHGEKYHSSRHRSKARD